MQIPRIFMKKLLILFVVLGFFAAGPLFAQVTIRIDSLPDQTPGDAPVYIAGDFNGWGPGDSQYRLTEDSAGFYGITLKAMPEGTIIKFKFTRGSWKTVEKGASGEEIANRQFTYGNGDTLHLKILNWADLSGGGGGSTADSNVHILAKAFYMPQLGRYRTIRVYLPPDYHLSSKPYPVLYMQDGQNLFDDQTSFAGEWQVDETLNRLFTEGKKVPIVIGIDNGGSRRIDELTPWANPKYGGGEGKKYVQFIVETLKPYVDSVLRTLPSRENTAIMGSSLGGLVSDYAAVAYPEVFGMAGVFSPSFWFSDSVWRFTRLHPATSPVRFYMLCGGAESEQMAPDMLAMKDSLVAAGFEAGTIFTKVVPGGQHNEKLWRGAFGPAWLWLSQQEGTTSVKVRAGKPGMKLSPNPARNSTQLSLLAGAKIVEVKIFDAFGRMVRRVDRLSSGRLNVQALSPGIYFLLAMTSERKFYISRLVKR